MLDNNERFRQLGLNIAHFRKLKGLSQEKLADRVHISRTHLSHIEAPNMVSSFSIAILFDIADALEIDIRELFEFRDK